MNETQRQLVLLLGIMVMLTAVFTSLELFNSSSPDINSTQPVNGSNISEQPNQTEKPDGKEDGSKSVIQQSIEGLQALWQSFLRGLSLVL